MMAKKWRDLYAQLPADVREDIEARTASTLLKMVGAHPPDPDDPVKTLNQWCLELLADQISGLEAEVTGLSRTVAVLVARLDEIGDHGEALTTANHIGEHLFTVGCSEQPLPRARIGGETK